MLELNDDLVVPMRFLDEMSPEEQVTYSEILLKCKRRSNYPSLKRPGIPVAPE
jgi:hypothetical protein